MTTKTGQVSGSHRASAPANAGQEFVAGGHNAIIQNIKSKMGICPYYKTNEILIETLYQKKSWGGKDMPENTVKMSSAAEVDYRKFAEANGVLGDQSPEYYKELFQKFLNTPKPKLTEKERFSQALKSLVTLRHAFMDERIAMESRLRNVGKTLDGAYPIEGAKKIKIIEKFRAENTPLIEDIKEEKLSWDNMIAYSTAQMGYFQKSVIEGEIEKLIAELPIWKYYAKHIPGLGAGTVAFIISRLVDPKRFAYSDRVRAFCGMAPKGGETMKLVRGQKIKYDPGMKELLCRIFPDSFMKVSVRFPDEPYSKFFNDCRIKQLKKAESTTIAELAKKFEVSVENIIPLGYGKLKDKQGNEIEGGEDRFLGFKVKKNGKKDTLEFHGRMKYEAAKEKHKGKIIEDVDLGEDASPRWKLVVQDNSPKMTLNPGHVLQRAMREFGAMVISDFYHAWLFLEGENPRVEGNPRIMAVFAKANMVKD